MTTTPEPWNLTEAQRRQFREAHAQAVERRMERGSDEAHDGFPFPLAEPMPEPVMVTRPCGCTSMVTEPGARPLQVSWCARHDPGYEQEEASR